MAARLLPQPRQLAGLPEAESVFYTLHACENDYNCA